MLYDQQLQAVRDRQDAVRAAALRARERRALPPRQPVTLARRADRLRHAVGFGLVEAGLRLAVGRPARPRAVAER